MPPADEETNPAHAIEADLSTAFARLAEATRAPAAAVDLESARRALEARLAAEAPQGAGASGGRLSGGRLSDRSRTAPPHCWPALALAAAALCLLFLWAQRPQNQPATKLQEVRFDSSLWELDRIADSPTGRATAEMTEWTGR